MSCMTSPDESRVIGWLNIAAVIIHEHEAFALSLGTKTKLCRARFKIKLSGVIHIKVKVTVISTTYPEDQ